MSNSIGNVGDAISCLYYDKIILSGGNFDSNLAGIQAVSSYSNPSRSVRYRVNAPYPFSYSLYYSMDNMQSSWTSVAFTNVMGAYLKQKNTYIKLKLLRNIYGSNDSGNNHRRGLPVLHYHKIMEI